MEKLDKLIKALRGNDKRVVAFLQMSDEKAYRMFSLGVAVFLSSMVSIAVYGITKSFPLASYLSVISLGVLGPLSIICCNRYLRKTIEAPDGMLPANQLLKLDFQEELRVIDELKLPKKETLLLRKKAFDEYKTKKEQSEKKKLN